MEKYLYLEIRKKMCESYSVTATSRLEPKEICLTIERILVNVFDAPINETLFVEVQELITQGYTIYVDGPCSSYNDLYLGDETIHTIASEGIFPYDYEEATPEELVFLKLFEYIEKHRLSIYIAETPQK